MSNDNNKQEINSKHVVYLMVVMHINKFSSICEQAIKYHQINSSDQRKDILLGISFVSCKTSYMMVCGPINRYFQKPDISLNDLTLEKSKNLSLILMSWLISCRICNCRTDDMVIVMR